MNINELEIEFANHLQRIGLQINEAHFSLFSRYFHHLVEVNQVMNLTGITDPLGVYFKHFYDSLYAIQFLHSRTNVRILDIGPGAGFPSIPLRIILQDANFTLIESLQKRVKFLDSLSTILDLSNVDCVHGRAEELAHLSQYRENYDFVVIRAVSNLSTLIEVSIPYLSRNGLLICLKGPDITEELKFAQNSLSLLNAEVVNVHHYDLPFSLGGRSIVVIKRKGLFPNKLPRKQGLPFNKPL